MADTVCIHECATATTCTRRAKPDRRAGYSIRTQLAVHNWPTQGPVRLHLAAFKASATWRPYSGCHTVQNRADTGPSDARSFIAMAVSRTRTRYHDTMWHTSVAALVMYLQPSLPGMPRSHRTAHSDKLECTQHTHTLTLSQQYWKQASNTRQQGTTWQAFSHSP